MKEKSKNEMLSFLRYLLEEFKRNPDVFPNLRIDIKTIQKGNSRSPFPDEIIFEHKGNIFFNFRHFVKGLTEDTNHVVKEVFLLVEDSSNG